MIWTTQEVQNVEEDILMETSIKLEDLDSTLMVDMFIGKELNIRDGYFEVWHRGELMARSTSSLRSALSLYKHITKDGIA